MLEQEAGFLGEDVWTAKSPTDLYFNHYVYALHRHRYCVV